MIPFILKVGNQYVCWNSFKSTYYLGKKSHSEIFSLRLFGEQDLRLNGALNLFPTAKKIWVTF